MSKKLFGKAAGVLALVIGMAFISCDDKVTINLSKAPAVKAVTVTKTTNNKYFIVSWDAAGADLAYDVFIRQDGKISSRPDYSSSIVQNENTYDPDTGATRPNADFDKWSCRIGTVYTETAGSYNFGVRSDFNIDSKYPNPVDKTYSAITWSTPFAMTAGPKVASVTATKTTDGRYIIVTWNDVADADTYNIYQEKDYDDTATYLPASNDWAYAVADGASTANTDDSKWSCRINVSGAEDEGVYRFFVQAGDSTADYDIGVLRGVKVYSNTVTVTD